jgi:hypothetical protein
VAQTHGWTAEVLSSLGADLIFEDQLQVISRFARSNKSSAGVQIVKALALFYPAQSAGLCTYLATLIGAVSWANSL